MPRYSVKSKKELLSCHHWLQLVFKEVIKEFDCAILQGARGAVIQMGYYHLKPRKTKLVYPDSKHNPEIDIGSVSAILGCDPSLDSIRESIVNASDEQLISIDELETQGKSFAIDVIPFPVDWRFEKDICHYGHAGLSGSINWDVIHNIERWFKFGGKVLGIAQQLGIPLIWGGDWDGDNQMSDQRSDDLPHFELKHKR
ncbi:hypothetical protein KAR91_15240 [Candidatus Pacearchaeota archaeon]|nr:hypothetical protein [Candidatus Pacearchaeota archaeon]